MDWEPIEDGDDQYDLSPFLTFARRQDRHPMGPEYQGMGEDPAIEGGLDGEA